MATSHNLSDSSKTYKTASNAHKAMESYNDSLNYVVVCTVAGRFQPLITACGVYSPYGLAASGFMVVGV